MLQAGSMETEVSFNTPRASVAYELLFGSYRGFSGPPLSLSSVEGGGGVVREAFYVEVLKRINRVRPSIVAN